MSMNMMGNYGWLLTRCSVLLVFTVFAAVGLNNLCW